MNDIPVAPACPPEPRGTHLRTSASSADQTYIRQIAQMYADKTYSGPVYVALSRRLSPETQPLRNRCFNLGELLLPKHAEAAKKPGVRHRDDTLSVERARLQEPNGHGAFEACSSNCGRMRHERHQGSLGVRHRNAQDQTGADLRSETKVDEPDLAAVRLVQSFRSIRSYSRKTASAAATNSSSPTSG